MKQLFNYFSRLGSKYNLTFSSQVILRDCIMGVDGIKRKLLVFSGIKKGPYKEHIIDLNDVVSCSVKKHYGRIDVNGLQKRKLDHYLEKMVLQFGFRSKKEPSDVLFYTRTYNDISELPVLEQKATKWREMIHKLNYNICKQQQNSLS